MEKPPDRACQSLGAQRNSDVNAAAVIVADSGFRVSSNSSIRTCASVECINPLAIEHKWLCTWPFNKSFEQKMRQQTEWRTPGRGHWKENTGMTARGRKQRKPSKKQYFGKMGYEAE